LVHFLLINEYPGEQEVVVVYKAHLSALAAVHAVHAADPSK